MSKNRPPICAQVTSVHQGRDVRIFGKIARTLAGAGYEVVVIHPAGAIPDESGVRFSGVQLGGSRLWRALFGGLKVFLRARQLDATVFHFHDPELIPWGLLWRLLGRPAVYDVHEDVPQSVTRRRWVPVFLRIPSGYAMAGIEWLAGHCCSAVIAATGSIGRRFPAQRTIVVHNYPEDLDRFVPVGGLPEQRKNVAIYTGSLSADRGLGVMIDAIDQVPTELCARLVLAGPLREEVIVDSAGRAPGERPVEYAGHLPREEAIALLWQARVGLHVVRPLPHFKVSVPIKLFEYMAAGLPVVVSDFPDWREIVVRHRCGLVVDPLDPRALAEAMTTIFRDPAEARAMGERGRAAVRAHFSWGAEAERLLGLYQRILPGPPGVSARPVPNSERLHA